MLPTFPTFFCTNVGYLETKSFVYPFIEAGDGHSIFDDNGLGLQTNVWNLITYPFGLPENVVPVWVDEPPDSSYYWRGFNYFHRCYANWNFQYCTDAYWD